MALRSVQAQALLSSPALLPSSRETSSGAAQWGLGLVCLVEAGLKPGRRARPPLDCWSPRWG